MEENKDEFDQEEVKWVVPEFEELLKNQENQKITEDKEELEETTEKENVSKEELEKLNEEIEKKEKEMEQIQILIDYYESGEAYRENEENFSNGMIDEKEYEETKRKIDEEFDLQKSNMLTVQNELQELLNEKEKITGIKQKDVTEKTELEESQEEQLEEKNIEDEVKENTQENKEAKEEKEEKSKNDNNNKSNISNDAGNNNQGEQIEENLVQEQEIQVYKEPNRFIEFLKKAIEKVKKIIKRDREEEFEEVVIEGLNNNGYDVDRSKLKDLNLGSELSSHVYNENEIIKNYNNRETNEQLIGKEQRNIENEKNIK